MDKFDPNVFPFYGDSSARLNSFGFNTTSFWFNTFGLTGRLYRLEVATNLNGTIVWTPVITNNVSYFYTNFNRTNYPMLFYRGITNN